jgi:hypothetical protein
MADTLEKGYNPDLWEKNKDGAYEFKGSMYQQRKFPLLPPDIRDNIVPTKKSKTGGSGGSGPRDMQLGSDLDPKAMMKKEERMKSGGKVKSASSRADGCAIRGKTRA